MFLETVFIYGLEKRDVLSFELALSNVDRLLPKSKNGFEVVVIPAQAGIQPIKTRTGSPIKAFGDDNQVWATAYQVLTLICPVLK